MGDKQINQFVEEMSKQVLPWIAAPKPEEQAPVYTVKGVFLSDPESFFEFDTEEKLKEFLECLTPETLLRVKINE